MPVYPATDRATRSPYRAVALPMRADGARACRTGRPHGHIGAASPPS